MALRMYWGQSDLGTIWGLIRMPRDDLVRFGTIGDGLGTIWE